MSLARRLVTLAATVTAVLAVSAAPAEAADPVQPGTYTVTIQHAGQQRTALVHVPTGYDGTSPLPTLLHFPGLLETPEMAELFDHHFEHADANRYLMVIPAHYGIGWQGVPGGTDSPDVDDPGFVRALLDTVQERFHADPNRIYASGMSNGGFFTHRMACELSDRFAAYAAVSGQLPTTLACSPGHTRPIMMIHGTGDPLVPYEGGESPVAAAAAFWTARNGCGSTETRTALPDTTADNTTVIRHDWPGCPAETPVVLYEIVNGGHTWPGGTPFLPPPLLGWHCTDIVANQVIWDYVSPRHLS